MSERINVIDFDSQQAFEEAVARVLREQLQEAGSAPHAIMLSGGRTPLPIFARLAADPVAISRSVHVMYSDERHVPVDSPDSNHGAALPMLRALEVPKDRVLRVHTEYALEESARRYEQALRGFLERDGRIALAFLGIGADGHTCSLFTPQDLASAAGHLAIPVLRPAPPHRISVTPELLAQVERVIFLVSGADKAPVVDALMHAPESLVAGRAVAGCRHLELWRV